MLRNSLGAVRRLCLLAHSSIRFFAGTAIVAALLTGAFAAWVGIGLGGAAATTAVDDLAELVAAALAAIGCAIAACRSRGRIRAAWVLIAAATFSWAAGETVYSWYEVVLRTDVPSPSAADVGFLLTVPLGIAGLLLFAAPAARTWERARALVDGLLIAASVLFVSWEFVLGPIYRTSRLSMVAKVVILAYPVGDVAMISIAAFALSRVRAENRTSLALLVAGIVGLSVADSAYAYLSATSYYVGNALDTGWVGGFLLIMLASMRARTGALHEDHEAGPGQVRLLIPYGAFLVAFLSGAWVNLTGGALTTVGLTIALAVAAFTLASNLLVQWENRSLLQRSQANERALVESRRALLQVVESAPVILFAVDPAGTLTLVTGAGLAGFGAGPADLEGRDVREVLKGSPDFLAAVEAALAGRPGQVVASFDEGDLDVRLLPLVEAGRVLSVSGVAIDVSERRRAELARRESEAKSRFLATMTHELRTPLNSILGFSELLLGERRGPLNEQQKRYVANVLGSGRHLLALITDLMDLHRVAAGEVEVSLQRTNLPEAIKEAAARVRPMAERKRLELSVDEGAPPEVLADPLRLQQVLLNLLSNAVKFTEDGGAIGIGARNAEDGVVVSVRDSGVGIRPEHLELIFDEYSQLDTPMGPVREGIGLGLAVSRRLAILMRGRLEAESVFGQGSIFHLHLQAPASPAARQPVEARTETT